MVMTQSSLSELLAPGLKIIFGDMYNMWTPEVDQYFDSETSSRAYEDYQELAGLGLVPVKAESAANSYDDALQGNKTTLTNLTYSLGFKVTREMKDDDMYRKINSMPKALAKSVAQTVDTTGANILNRAFTNTYTGGDGVELCSRLHTQPGGGTYANEPSVQADLSMTSFEQALVDIAAITNGRGQVMKIMPRKLIVSPLFEATAKRILESVGDPETAERSINPFKNKVELFTSYYKTDTDSWFIRTDVPGLIMQKRVWPAEFREDNAFDEDIAKFKTYFRLAFGWYDPRSIYGVTGA